MPRRYYSSTAQRTTLNGAITNSATSVVVSSAVGLPSSFPYTMVIDPDTGSEELVEVTARATNTLTVVRGVDGTTAVSHLSGAYIQHAFSARDFDEPNAFLNGALFAQNPQMIAPEERWNIVAASTTGTIAVNLQTAANWYYTTASTASFILNFRGSATTTLSSMLAVGDSISSTFMNTTGAATTSYPTAIQVDGTVTGVSTRWMYGTTPTTGNASSVDCYTFMIVKTAATPTYTIFASAVKW